jgi:hypothetical protein
MMSRVLRSSVPMFLTGLAALVAFGPTAVAAERTVLAEDFTGTW